MKGKNITKIQHSIMVRKILSKGCLISYHSDDRNKKPMNNLNLLKSYRTYYLDLGMKIKSSQQIIIIFNPLIFMLFPQPLKRKF